MRQPEVLERVHQLLDQRLRRDGQLEVLEAGGGSFSHIRHPKNSRIVLLDVSPEQLERHPFADERILADLETWSGHERRFDLIVCYDVFEHLNRPNLAFSALAEALAPGGLLVLGCPNRQSLKAMVTRYTPHAFHVWYYRHIRGIRDAGQPGHAPFPAPMRRDMSLPRLKAAADAFGLEILEAQGYVSPTVEELAERFPPLHALYSALAWLLHGLNGRRGDPRDSDVILVLRRGGATAARTPRRASAAA